MGSVVIICIFCSFLSHQRSTNLDSLFKVPTLTFDPLCCVAFCFIDFCSHLRYYLPLTLKQWDRSLVNLTIIFAWSFTKIQSAFSLILKATLWVRSFPSFYRWGNYRHNYCIHWNTVPKVCIQDQRNFSCLSQGLLLFSENLRNTYPMVKMVEAWLSTALTSVITSTSIAKKT